MKDNSKLLITILLFLVIFLVIIFVTPNNSDYLNVIEGFTQCTQVTGDCSKFPDYFIINMYPFATRLILTKNNNTYEINGLFISRQVKNILYTCSPLYGTFNKKYLSSYKR